MTLLEQLIYTLALLEANPLTASLAPPFEELQKSWETLSLDEAAQLVEVYRADALVVAADDALDDFVDELDKVLLRLVKNNRDDLLYAYYFGAKRPFVLKRPVLGGQLETMRTWIPSLLSASDPDLVLLGKRLEVLVAAADEALAKQAAAKEAVKTFRALGGRKSFIDRFNAVRKSTDGKLAEMPHARPEARLPMDFASRFFKHESRRSKNTSKELTSEGLKAQIEDTKGQLHALEGQLAEAITKDEAEDRANKQVQTDRADLAASEKAYEALAAKMAGLRAKLPRG
jgi:hypothetical protein